MKILHLSDIHAQHQGFAEIKKCCDFIIDTAAAEQPDLIIHSGDTFENSDIRLDSEVVKYIFSFFTGLADIAPVSAIIGTPSHDGKAIEVLNHVKAAHPIHVTSEAPEQLFLVDGRLTTEPFVGMPGRMYQAIISAFPAPSKRWYQTDSPINTGEMEIAQGITKIMAAFGAVADSYDCAHILNGHFNVTGAFVSGTQVLTGVDVEISQDQIAMEKFDLAALGHIHKKQQIGENIFFAGGIANHTWGEMGAKGFYIHEFERSEGDARPEYQRSRFIETPTKPMIDLAYDFTGKDAQELGIDLFLTAALNSMDKERLEGSKVRLTIKVFNDEYEKMDRPRIEEFFKAAELTLEPIRLPRENVRSERIQELETLFDKIKENAAILEEEIPPGIEAKAAMLEAGNADKLLEEVKAL